MTSKKDRLLKERAKLFEKLDEIDLEIDQIEREIIFRNFPEAEKRKEETEALIKKTKQHILMYKTQIENSDHRYYCEIFDCYYQKNGEWVEDTCKNAPCQYCDTRPEKHHENCECLKKKAHCKYCNRP